MFTFELYCYTIATLCYKDYFDIAPVWELPFLSNQDCKKIGENKSFLMAQSTTEFSG